MAAHAPGVEIVALTVPSGFVVGDLISIVVTIEARLQSSDRYPLFLLGVGPGLLDLAHYAGVHCHLRTIYDYGP